MPDLSSMNHNDYGFLGHWLSAGAIVTSLIGALPTMIALLASVAALTWYCITIYECKLVQGWLAQRREQKMVELRDKLARLEAEHEAKR